VEVARARPRSCNNSAVPHIATQSCACHSDACQLTSEHKPLPPLWSTSTSVRNAGHAHDRRSTTEVAQYLDADLTPLARRFWAPVSRHETHPLTAERAGIDCACELESAHTDVAQALWDLHPVVTDPRVPLKEKLGTLPPRAHAFACARGLVASPDGPCLRVRSACMCEVVAAVLPRVDGIRALDIELCDKREFAFHSSEAGDSDDECGGETFHVHVESGKRAAAMYRVLARAAAALPQPLALRWHSRTHRLQDLCPEAAPHLVHLSVAGRCGAGALHDGLPKAAQLQGLTSLAWEVDRRLPARRRHALAFLFFVSHIRSST
jgi:hypothetical protein